VYAILALSINGVLPSTFAPRRHEPLGFGELLFRTLELVAFRVGLLKIDRTLGSVVGLNDKIVGRVMVVSISGLRYRPPRDDTHVSDYGFAINKMLGQPRQKQDVCLVV
jgi:hypothetical protein